MLKFLFETDKQNENYIKTFFYITIILLGVFIGTISAKFPLFALFVAVLIAFLIILFLIFFKDGYLSLKRAIIPLLIASILLPPIRLPAGIPDFRVELILILIIWVLVVFGHFATGKSLKFQKFPVLNWFIFFGMAILLSIFYGTVIKGNPVIGRDLWEFGKLLEYFLIFTFIANLNLSKNEIKHLYVVLLLLFLIAGFFGLAQYFNLFNINESISPYYAPTQMRGLLVHKRITGTTGNPNEFGALMVLASSLAFSGVLFLKIKTMCLFSLICFLFFVLSIVLTLSRSALIALSIAICFLTLFKYPLIVGLKRGIKKFLIIIPFMIIIGIIIINIAPEKFFLRVSRLKNIWEDASWQERILMWKFNYDIWKLSPIFGWGPGKETMTTIVDNEWLLLLRRYGLVGVIFFILWFKSFYNGLSKIYRNSLDLDIKALAIALQATLLAYAVYMIPVAVYHSLQLMPILMILLGVNYTQYKKRKAY